LLGGVSSKEKFKKPYLLEGSKKQKDFLANIIRFWVMLFDLTRDLLALQIKEI